MKLPKKFKVKNTKVKDWEFKVGWNRCIDIIKEMNKDNYSYPVIERDWDEET